jgi:hypothetical protein
VARSGGLAGITRVSEQVVVPGSPGHRAARQVLDGGREDGGATTRPDAFRYDVSIAAPDGELLHTTFRDPLPPAVADLLAAMSPTAPGRPTS